MLQNPGWALEDTCRVIPVVTTQGDESHRIFLHRRLDCSSLALPAFPQLFLECLALCRIEVHDVNKPTFAVQLTRPPNGLSARALEFCGGMMKRVALIVGLCALLSPMAAWASGIDLTNWSGVVTINTSGIASYGSQLLTYGDQYKAAKGHALGSVSFSTGAFTPGTTSGLWGNGTFSSVGSSFVVLGVGTWAHALTGCTGCKNPISLVQRQLRGSDYLDGG